MPLSAIARAMPKSITLTALVVLIMMLAGLTSRWMMPFWWLKFSAWHASAMISMARRGGSGPSVHDVAQGDAVDVLHHDVGQRPGRRLGLAGVVDGDDGRVIQRGRVLRFAPEAEVEARIAGQIRAQHLDRDVPMQTDVTGQMNLGHTPKPRISPSS